MLVGWGANVGNGCNRRSICKQISSQLFYVGFSRSAYPDSNSPHFPPLPLSKSHRGTDSQTRDFIVRLANAMMVFGAPTHRLEKQLEATARVLECDAHFFYLPSHVCRLFRPQAYSLRLFMAF
jgi:hypothetical protein